MGGTNTPQAEPMDSVLSAYTQYLPGLVSATAAQQPSIAQNQLNATMATQPLYNALNLQQAQQYSVPLAEVGQQVQRSNALAGAQTQVEQMQGPGAQAALTAEQIARATNPNYYGIQDAASGQARNLLNSINLNGLSGGEQAAVERSLAQSNVGTGNLGLNNATNTVGNAMNFGGAYNQKLGILGNALGAANQTATSAQNTGFNPVNIALGQPNSSTMGNFGTGTFSNTSANTQNQSGSNAFNFGSNMLGTMGSMNNANVGAAASQNNAQMDMIGNALGGACCFIFLEAYHGKMPKFVRKSRDHYYRKHPQIAVGYRRMATWLVPAMRHSDVARLAVWHLLVKPITKHLDAVNNRTKQNKLNRAITHMWLKVWNKLGKNHTEAEYLKPWMLMMKGVN